MPPKALDEIVIPPMAGIDGKFTCIGNGLMYDGHSRETIDMLKMLLLPVAGGEAIGDRAKPKAWWTAQALLYELPCPKNATIPAIRALLEATLKANMLGISQQMKDLEAKSNRDFRRLNKQVWEKTGGGVPKAANQKKAAASASALAAKAEIKETLKPTKATASTPVDAGLKNGPTAAQAKKVKPTVFKSKPTTPPIPVVTPAGALASAPTHVPLHVDPPYVETAPRTKQTARKSTGGAASKRQPTQPPSSGDCVTGQWSLRCRHIEDGWDEGYDLLLTVARTGHKNDIEADFELRTALGYLRSTSTRATPSGGLSAKFEWVGREYCGPVCTPSPSQVGTLKFSVGADGIPTLKGTIGGMPASGDEAFVFTGQWLSPKANVESSWGAYDEEEYERANRARWGRGGW